MKRKYKIGYIFGSVGLFLSFAIMSPAGILFGFGLMTALTFVSVRDGSETECLR